MKRFTFLMVALALVATAAAAQINLNYTTVFNAESYAAGVADTSGAYYVAGANRLSLVVTTADSAELDVVVQYQTNGTWTAVLTDSLVTTTATGATQEYSITDADSDLLDGIYYPLRVIITGQATGCGVTTATFRARFYYRI